MLAPLCSPDFCSNAVYTLGEGTVDMHWSIHFSCLFLQAMDYIQMRSTRTLNMDVFYGGSNVFKTIIVKERFETDTRQRQYAAISSQTLQRPES